MVGAGPQTHNSCARAVVLVAIVTLVSMVYLLGSDVQLQVLRPVLLPMYVDNTSITATKEGYLVWSPVCQIPDMNPYHESIKKFIKSSQSIVCSKFSPLTYVSPASNGEPYVLRVDTNIAHQYVGKQNYTCCYSNVTRPLPNYNDSSKSTDNKYNMGNCENFTKEVTLKPQTDFIYVKCSVIKNGKPDKEVYKNMHAMIPIKPQVRDKINQTEGQNKPNMIIVGLDSVSRLNFIRTLPKTLAYLKRGGWVEFKGYNKMGDNTFPNLIAFLTGHTKEDLKTCWNSSKEELDHCPYVWKEFSNQGYVTLYAEDLASISTFNYHKKGFITPPTDYYFRPFVLAAEKNLPLKSRDGMTICLGPVSTTDHFLKYLTDFSDTFRNSPYFGFIWLNNLSHNAPNNVGAMDYRFLQFFTEMEQSGTLNNTFVVFLSDHGMRFGKMRETVVGWYEERLPFMQIWIPKWFRRKYPEYYDNILVNRDKLTSPYDLHLMFKHILAINTGNITDENQMSINGTVSCPTCRSMFTEIPYNRSCEDAGITEHWCTCNQYETRSTVDDDALEAAKYVVVDINKSLKKAVNNTGSLEKCAELSLKRLVNVRGRVKEKDKHVDLVLVVETEPGNALFEATVRHQVQNKSYEVLGAISRINMYLNQSKCVNDSSLKLYCFCVKS